MAHQYGLLPQAVEDELHTAPDGRMLGVEKRAFDSISKRMLSISKLEFGAKSNALQTATDEQNQAPVDTDEQRAAYYEQYKTDLLLYFAAFDSTVIRAQFTLDSNKRERERYAKEQIELKNTTQMVRENNVALHEELKEAQKLLETRKGYDRLTEKITANKELKPRDEQQTAIDKLNAEIAELEAESQEFVKTRAERGEQFGRIVAECKHLLGLIHGDREEVERQDAMDEASRSSRDGTPAGASTPAHTITAAETNSPSHGSKLRESTLAVDAVDAVNERADSNKEKVEADAEMQEDSQIAEEKSEQDTQVSPALDATPLDEGGAAAAVDPRPSQSDDAGVQEQPKPDTMDET